MNNASSVAAVFTVFLYSIYSILLWYQKSLLGIYLFYFVWLKAIIVIIKRLTYFTGNSTRICSGVFSIDSGSSKSQSILIQV